MFYKASLLFTLLLAAASSPALGNPVQLTGKAAISLLQTRRLTLSNRPHIRLPGREDHHVHQIYWKGQERQDGVNHL